MEGAREQSCLYHVSAELNTSSKVADSSFTTDWLLSNLHLFDPQFSKINELGTVTKITAVDISDGKGFISKVYKVDLNFEHTNDPYEVILKVPGVDSFNNAYQDEKDRKQNVNVMTERFFSTLHNRECDFYLNFASHLDIPLAKIYKVQKWVLGKQPGALMMESMLGKGDSYPLPDGANIQQIFEVVKHICSFQKYGLSLPTEQWSGKYSYKVFDYFARNNINAPFFEKLKMLKPGVFDEGIKVLEKYRLNKKFMNYVMIDIHKDLGLPAVLCHGDFWNNNILWKRDSSGFLSNEIAAIIDWQGFHEGCRNHCSSVQSF